MDDSLAKLIVPAIRQLVAGELSTTMSAAQVQAVLTEIDSDIEEARSKVAAVKPGEKKGFLGIPLSLD